MIGAKDPRYAPALYERIVLHSKKYGPEFHRAVEALQASRGAPTPPGLRRVERHREDLRLWRERIERDCAVLEEELGRRAIAEVSQANALAARGILACWQGRTAEAEALLREAVRRDPLLEEAWDTLGLALSAESSDDLRRLEECCTEAISHDRGYVPHRLHRASIRARAGDAAGAEEDLREAARLEITPRP